MNDHESKRANMTFADRPCTIVRGFPQSIEKEGGPFAVLLLVDDADDFDCLLRLGRAYIQDGCEHLCCVGERAEELHDALDAFAEDANRLDVVTTWHSNRMDGCEYFLFGVPGDVRRICWIGADVELIGLLQQAALV